MDKGDHATHQGAWHKRTYWVLPLLLLGLTACGGGGGGSVTPGKGPLGPSLAMEASVLPMAHIDVPYGPVALPVVGADADALDWRLHEGTLPEGLSMTLSGVILGTPVRQGVWQFSVHATDGTRAATASYAIAVDTLGIYIRSGLVEDAAWSGKPVTLQVVGHTSDVTFDTGGQGTLQDIDPAAGTATWIPQAVPQGGWLVDLRAETANGEAHSSVRVEVRTNPIEGFTAAFGDSDVWYLDMTAKIGSHAYASDLHAALVLLGLRGPASTDPVGRSCDALADLCVRRATLSRLSTMFLRDADGRTGTAGLPISFPFEEPASVFAKPVPGDQAGGASNRFSVIAVLDGSQSGVVGTAFVDSGSNANHENNTTPPGAYGGEEFGVFVNRVASYVRTAWRLQILGEDPVGPSDVDTLRDILDGIEPTDARGALLYKAIEAFGGSLASITAHEIGHSLGFEHNEQSASGAIMNAAAAVGPNVQAAFLPSRINTLRTALPGVGRGGSFLQMGTQAKPMEEHDHTSAISVCAGRVCNQVLPGMPWAVRITPRDGGAKTPTPPRK